MWHVYKTQGNTNCNVSFYLFDRNEPEILIPIDEVVGAGVYVENSNVGINYFIIPPNRIDKE